MILPYVLYISEIRQISFFSLALLALWFVCSGCWVCCLIFCTVIVWFVVLYFALWLFGLLFHICTMTLGFAAWYNAPWLLGLLPHFSLFGLVPLVIWLVAAHIFYYDYFCLFVCLFLFVLFCFCFFFVAASYFYYDWLLPHIFTMTGCCLIFLSLLMSLLSHIFTMSDELFPRTCILGQLC